MDDKMIEELKAAGIDVEGARNRFMGNLDMLERFLKKFLADNNYTALADAMEAGETQAAFNAAHTLKGVCGNLSLTPLYEAVSDITELLRAGDIEGASPILPRVADEYEKMKAVISRLE